jgi:hypothetical protein
MAQGKHAILTDPLLTRFPEPFFRGSTFILYGARNFLASVKGVFLAG